MGDRGGKLAQGRQFAGAGQFSGPSGLAFDSEDNLYVVDTFNHRVQRFTRDGASLGSWGSAGVDEGPILCQTAFPVPPKTTGDELCRLHWVAARPAFVQALRWMQQGRVTLDPTIGEVVIDGAVFEPGSVSPNLEFDPSRLPLQVS